MPASSPACGRRHGHTTGYKGYQKPQASPIASRPAVPWVQAYTGARGPRGSTPARAFLSDLVKQKGIAAKDQNGLGLCWSYGSTRAVEVQRAVQGAATLDLSPESVAGPVTHWRNMGGYASEAFDQLQSGGACESSFMDQPHSLRPKRWKPGWQDNAQLHEAVQWYDLESSDQQPIFDEVVSCLLSRVPVAAGLAWWGHLVCFLDAVILPPGVAPANTPDGTTVGILFHSSWGVAWPTPGANGLACLTESRATPMAPARSSHHGVNDE